MYPRSFAAPLEFPAVANRSLSTALTLSVLALVGCARQDAGAFLVRGARLAYPDFEVIIAREPVPYGSVGGALAVHRLQRNSAWVLGYREHAEGGLLSRTEMERFVKITVVFPRNSKPSGVYDIGKDALRTFYSSGSGVLNARNSCYAKVSKGSVDLKWIDAERYRVAIVLDIAADEFFPKHLSCHAWQVHVNTVGRIRPFTDLGAWDGVPRSYDLESEPKIDESWPP